MSFEISDHQLTVECDKLAADIFAEMLDGMAADETPENYRDEMNDQAHEAADGHQWVIYTHQAIMLCAHCNVDDGEAFLEDVGMPQEVTFGSLAAHIAYGEILARVVTELGRLIDDWEDTRETTTVDEDEEA